MIRVNPVGTKQRYVLQKIAIELTILLRTVYNTDFRLNMQQFNYILLDSRNFNGLITKKAITRSTEV